MVNVSVAVKICKVKFAVGFDQFFHWQDDSCVSKMGFSWNGVCFRVESDTEEKTVDLSVDGTTRISVVIFDVNLHYSSSVDHDVIKVSARPVAVGELNWKRPFALFYIVSEGFLVQLQEFCVTEFAMVINQHFVKAAEIPLLSGKFLNINVEFVGVTKFQLKRHGHSMHCCDCTFEIQRFELSRSAIPDIHREFQQNAFAVFPRYLTTQTFHSS